MIVLVRGDGCWQIDTNGIHSLEDTMKVATPRDFTNQNRRKPFVAELLVHAEEIDL